MKLARSLRDCAVATALLVAACLICTLLHSVAESHTAAPLIFVLCVLLISRLTTGYILGILASVVCVLCVNYLFTYPFMAFNFTISGYPLTFVTFLAVSISTSALTTNSKHHEALKLENERERMRAQLLRAVSHDLRTPLTSIAGSVGAVLDNDAMPPEERHELLSGVRDDSEWLIRMVENLLSVTRMSGDDAQIVKSDEPMEEVVGGAVHKFKNRFPGVSVEVSVPGEVLFVPMDAVLICQVLMNLMENAVYHGADTTKIMVNVTLDGPSAVVSVSDNGQGISPRLLPYLFKEGTAPTTSVPVDSGQRHNMGIGLTVCNAIVNAHGGEINAENIPTGGAKFSFTLPRTE